MSGLSDNPTITKFRATAYEFKFINENYTIPLHLAAVFKKRSRFSSDFQSHILNYWTLDSLESIINTSEVLYFEGPAPVRMIDDEDIRADDWVIWEVNGISTQLLALRAVVGEISYFEDLILLAVEDELVDVNDWKVDVAYLVLRTSRCQLKNGLCDDLCGAVLMDPDARVDGFFPYADINRWFAHMPALNLTPHNVSSMIFDILTTYT